MYSKAMETARTSIRRVRGWFSEVRGSNVLDRTDDDGHLESRTENDSFARGASSLFEGRTYTQSEDSRTSGGRAREDSFSRSQRHFFDNNTARSDYNRPRSNSSTFNTESFLIDEPEVHDYEPPGRRHPIRNSRSFQDGGNILVDIKDFSEETEYICDVYVEENLSSSNIDRERSSSENKRFAFAASSHNITSTEISSEHGLMGHLLKPPMSTSQPTVGTLPDDPVAFRDRSRTLETKENRHRKNLKPFKRSPATSHKNFGIENDDHASLDSSGSNMAMRERRISICSITKITRAIVSTDERNDITYSEVVEEIVINSCEEEAVATFDEAVGGDTEASQRDEEYDDMKMPDEARAAAPSKRGPVAGRMKLCLQYFEASRALRVIVLRATNLKARKGHVYAKLTAYCTVPKRRKKVMKLSKVKAKSEVAFNEEVFFDEVDGDAIETLILSVRVYNKEGLLRSKKCLGEMVIPVYKYDLSMDTNIKGVLRTHRANLEDLDACYDDDDLEVISDDRSISASVAASLNKYRVLGSPFKRMNSVPTNQMNDARPTD